MAPARRHRLDDRRRRRGEVRGGARAGLEERGGLALDDLDVVVDGHRRVAPETALHDLALGQADAGLGRPADDLGLEAGAEREGAAEEEVAGDQRVGEAEGLQRRRPPAARLAAVDDVVVQERGRVDQLERDGGLDGVVAARERSAGGRRVEDEQDDGRPDALAARADEVRRRSPRGASSREPSSAWSRASTRCKSSPTGRGDRPARVAGGAVGDGLHQGRASRINSNRPAKSRTRSLPSPGSGRYAPRACRSSRRTRCARRFARVLFPGFRRDIVHLGMVGGRDRRRRRHGARAACVRGPTSPRCWRSSAARSRPSSDASRG